MEFFKKIFKALNSAQHPWQVTLAIALGMVAGLTPYSGTQTLLILFVVFLLNIHIGLFFAASAMFAGVAYLFDPQMEELGYLLLTNEGMKELYTAWYNNGLVRLSHFNNTLVMGATVISLLLAIPLFFVLNFIISLYREKIAAYLNSNRWFARLGIFKVKEKKEPLFRWWGAGLYLAVVGGAAAILLLVIDPLVKWGIEKGASSALKRDVRVGSVESRLFEGYVSINRVEVAGDKEDVDLFSIENIGFDIDTNALLLSKSHIENMQLKGVGFDTPATMNKAYGKAAYKEKVSAQEKAEAAKEAQETAEDGGMEMPSIELPTPKELLAKSELRSDKLYQDGEAEIAGLEAKWTKIREEQLSKAVLERYEKDLRQMQADANSKDAQKLLALAKKVNDYNNELKAKQKVLKSLQKEFSADQKRISRLLAEVKDAPMADYKKLRSTYSLDSSGGINLFGLLFSQKIAGYLHQARGYYAQVEPYLKSDEKDPEALPPRGEGRWVKFAEFTPSPDLWVARTELSGAKEGYTFKGVIKNISDSQKTLGKPLTFAIESDGEQVRGLHLVGEDNRLGSEVVDKLAFSAESLKMKRMDLNKMQISDAKIGFKGELKLVDAATLSGATDIAFYEAEIHLEDVGGKVAQILNDTLGEIHDFGAKVEVEGRWQKPSVKVDSEIDKLLSKAFKKVMAKEIAKYQKELELLLNEKAKEQLDKLSEKTGGIVDTGKLLDEQALSLEGLEKKAQELLSSDNSEKVVKDKATEYLKDEKTQDKLKKLFKF